MQNWNSHEINFLRESLDLSTKELYLKFCDEFGSHYRSYDSVQKKIKKLRDAMSDEPVEDDVDTGQAIQELLEGPDQLVVPDVTAEMRREMKQAAKFWLEGIIEESQGYTYTPDAIVEEQGSTLCVLISDSHVGKHNEQYNLAAAVHRFTTLPEKVKTTVGNTSVNEVCIMLMGDIVEGEDIFRTQAHHIECSALEQVQIATEAIWEMVLRFHEVFGCAVRVETVPGNHGRMSRTANEKTNWDNVIYYILRMLATAHDNPQIWVNANFSFFKTFEVKDKTGMIYHYGVKHTGTPAMREKVAGWSVNKNFDFMCHGHWHEWHVGNWLSKVVISNGCLCGPDDLAEKMAREDVARQGYFLVTPGQPIHGIGFVEWPDNGTQED